MEPDELLTTRWSAILQLDRRCELRLRHQLIFERELDESLRQMRPGLHLIEQGSVMVVRVCEHAVESPRDVAELLRGLRRDGVAIREGIGRGQHHAEVRQRVQDVVDRAALLRLLPTVSRAQEDPVLRRAHLRTRRGRALRAEDHHKLIEVHHDLSQRFVQPDGLVVVRRVGDDALDVAGVVP